VSRNTKLSTRILVSQLTILIVTVAVGFVLYRQHTRDALDRQYEERALAVAEAVAVQPEVVRALTARADPQGAVQALAEQMRHGVHALRYVVVIGRDGTRLSHPNVALIGKKIEEPVVALDGGTYVGVDSGSLGRSANGKAPVRASDGQVIGEVSAGILEEEVDTQLAREVPLLALYTGLALAFGALVSLMVARRLKRTTFGLELHEIASLLQEREAMLHSVREGVITLDPDDRVTLLNDEARRLLQVRTEAIGRRLDDVLPPGKLREILSGAITGRDHVVLTDEHCLVVNRIPVSLRGRALGAVVTLRDRTETEGLLRELTSTRGLTDALRAQQHEFSNRLHTAAGLLEIGETDEAFAYLVEISETTDGFAESVGEVIGSPVLAALVVAKASVAAERGVTMRLTEDSVVEGPLVDPNAIVTIVGNLVDNAIDAAASGPQPQQVTIRLRDDDARLTIEVVDTGPGVPQGADESIFNDGFTTKPARGAGGRGLGLAIVHREVRRLGGEIVFTAGPGAAFTVVIPAHTGTSELSGARP
jgi:two-component system CitB family sensor kinase